MPLSCPGPLRFSMSLNILECFLLWGEGGLWALSQMCPFILGIELCAQSLTVFHHATGYKSMTSYGNSSKPVTLGNMTKTATLGNRDHITNHVIKLTRNLLVLQKEGICCDVNLQCKDGIIPAHSGGPTSFPISLAPSLHPLLPTSLAHSLPPYMPSFPGSDCWIQPPSLHPNRKNQRVKGK